MEKRRNEDLEENEDIGDCVDHGWGVSGSTGKGSERGGGLEDGSESRMTMAALDQEKASQHTPYKAQDSHSATGKTKR